MEDYYQLLGVDRTATQEEIRERYRFLAKAYHPDRYQNPKDLRMAEEELKNINAAYIILGDSSKRTFYDRELESKKIETGLSDIEVVQQYQIGLNSHDLSVIDRLVADNFISHVAGIPQNKNEWKDLILQQIAAFEEYLSIIEKIYVQSGRVYYVLTEEFRQIAPFMGDLPNFKKIRMTTIESFRVENGLIMEIFPSTVSRFEEID
jgi:curved DNA-binding protein CbpA